jgi:hypothetical protein
VRFDGLRFVVFDRSIDGTRSQRTLSGQAGEIISLALAGTGGFSSNPITELGVEMTLFRMSGAAGPSQPKPTSRRL